MRTLALISILALAAACKEKPKPRPAPETAAKVETPTPAGNGQMKPAPDLELPHGPGTPPEKTTKPISVDQIKKLSEKSFAGFSTQVRRTDGKAFEVRYLTDDRPKIWAQVEIRPCDTWCMPMDVAKWKALGDDLKWAIDVPQLKASPDLKFEVGQTDLRGTPMIYTFQLGTVTYDGGGAATYAYILYWNDGTNQIRVLSRFADDPAPIDMMQKMVSRADLENVAKAFMDYFTHEWAK